MTQELCGLKVNDKIKAPWPFKGEATIVGFRYYTSRNNGRTSMVADYVTDKGEASFDALEKLVPLKVQAPAPAELLAALRELQKQLHAHITLDVKKHYSLMVADAAASTAIAKAEG